MLNLGQLNSHALNEGAGYTELSFEVTGAKYRLYYYKPAREWAISSAFVAQIIYLCRLNELPLSISSLHARMRDGQPTYVNVVVPGITQNLIDAIESRVGGDLVIYSGVRTIAGQDIVEELINSKLESFRYDLGGRSGSGTLVGYMVQTTTTSKVVDVTGVTSYSKQGTGKRRIRCEPSFFIRPGDVARYGPADGDKLIVGMITLNVSTRNIFMDLMER
ncbi:hypothetical protein [Desulfonatronovibrio hydrogenovorans]|uniref:hypothetical protein n=1 Tax=Desulfonatronovibrio hydrogenovorans TaxID=53245 RepID=UPI00048E853A|nr:hypothetical protein [Desulfonatronovibrio hydrogenovorans]